MADEKDLQRWEGDGSTVRRDPFPHALLEELPATWRDMDRMTVMVELHTEVYKALAIHGAIVCAMGQLQMSPTMRSIFTQLLDRMEAIFRSIGLEDPPEGWRSRWWAAPS